MSRVQILIPQASSSTRSPAHNVITARFYVLFAVLMVILVPAEFVLGSRAHLHRMGQQLIDAWPALSLMGACVFYVRWRPLPKIVDAAQIVLVSCLTFYVMGVLIHVAGRSPFGLADRQLADLDSTLHFHTASVVAQIARLRFLHLVLAIVYGTTGLMVIAAAIVPAVLGRAEYSYRFILTIIFAVIMTALLFYRWPAVGPWTVEGFAPSLDQATVAAYLTRLRSDLPVMDMKSVAIVSFPSFHTVMAIASARALHCIRSTRWFTWTLAALICASTITTGWHYGVDVLGGLAVALVSIAMADRILRVPRAA